MSTFIGVDIISVNHINISLIALFYVDCETRINIDNIVAYQEITEVVGYPCVRIYFTSSSNIASLDVRGSVRELSVKIKAAQKA